MPLTLFPTPSIRLSAERAAAPKPPPVAETDLDRVLKLVPTEVITMFTSAKAILGQATDWPFFDLFLTIAGVMLVVFILKRDGTATGMSPRLPQFLLRTLAFVAWALLVSEPLRPLSPWLSPDVAGWMGAIGVVAIPVLGMLALRNKPLSEE